MKIPLIFCLVLWITVAAQIGSSQIISKNGNKEIINENGTHIEVTEIGPLDIYVSNNELVFEVCAPKCFADFLVCYESDPPGQTTTDFVNERCDTKCGFYVTGNENATGNKGYFAYMSPDPPIFRPKKCEIATMTFKSFLIGVDPYTGCSPKIAENGLVKLNVLNATSDCPVSIKNAKLTLDVPTTVLPSNNNPNSPSNSASRNPPSENSPTSKSPATNIFGIFGWIFVFISISLFHQ